MRLQKRSRFAWLRSRQWIFMLLCGVIAVGGGLLTYGRYQEVDHSMRESLEIRATTMAELLPKDTILALSGSKTDLDSPAYQELKRVMTRARQVDPDTRFIYLFGERAGQVVFWLIRKCLRARIILRLATYMMMHRQS